MSAAPLAAPPSLYAAPAVRLRSSRARGDIAVLKPSTYALIAGTLLAVSVSASESPSSSTAPLPRHLHDTGLFVAGSATEVRPENLPFSPQYPLWSDGAKKRRWLYLPPGTTIDASHADAWEFPRGTRLWKEFSYDRPVETRYIERLPDGSWRFASYIWNDAGTDAELAPAAGVPQLSTAQTPGGRYAIPSQEDCRACHEGAAVPVLGASALQLSTERDSLAPHADPQNADTVDLRELVARGLVENLPASLADHAPRIVASNAAERAALGYLHGNCGHCHNDAGPLASLDFSLAQSVTDARASFTRTLRSTVNEPSQFVVRNISHRVVRGRADASVLALRMRSRDPLIQMPPLGTHLADTEAITLIERWINQDLPPQQESAP